MVIKHSIRLGRTNSKFSVNDGKDINVELKCTNKKLQYNSISDLIDLNAIYESERSSSTKYRIILTINPFCSNVLFNPFTEVMEKNNNGDVRCLWVNNDKNITASSSFIGVPIPLRQQYIANTSYSANNRDISDVEILPGYDIFDNHILRSVEVKVVNPTRTSTNSNGEFNTLSDYYRNQHGNVITQYFRDNGLERQPVSKTRHLYAIGDVKSFEECSIDSLYEKNGWFGFDNTSLLETVIKTTKTKKDNIVKFDNKRTGGEFIYMYPGRREFGFIPYYNSEFNRLEYNWDIKLTYASENDYLIPLVHSDYETEKVKGGYNGLLIMKAERLFDINGNEIIKLKTYTRHNLNVGSSVVLFLEIDVSEGSEKRTVFTNFSKIFGVNGVGGAEDEDGYVFTIDASEFPTYVRIADDGDKDEFLYYTDEFIDSIYYTQKDDIPSTVKEISEATYNSLTDENLKKCYKRNEDEPAYVLRLSIEPELWISLPSDYKDYFKKEFSIDETEYYKIFSDSNKEEFRLRKIVNGVPCVYYERKMKEIEIDEEVKEKYGLAFASTIYGDECAQITFKESIDLDGYKDNLGRPLTDVYVTFIKKNIGSDVYKSNGTTVSSKDIEISHCFTGLSHGYILSEMGEFDEIADRETYNDIHCICKTEDEDVSEILKNGDIVEFSPSTFTETVIADSGFRFNTFQRDNLDDDVQLTVHEIASDDNISDGFSIEEVKYDTCGQYREGYYYKSHHRVPVKENTLLHQGSHTQISIYSISPVQSGQIMLQVMSMERYITYDGAIVYLRDETNDQTFEFRVVNSVDRRLFNIKPVDVVTENKEIKDGWDALYEKSSKIYTESLNWINICDFVSRGLMVLMFKNEEIPDYAVMVGRNTYIWRDIDYIGSINSNSDTELIFTNGCFYLTPQINFYLMRQDPNGVFRMQNSDVYPADIPGNYTTFYKENKSINEEEMEC